jgi:two-component system NtrC family sensor kinase
MFGPSEIAQAQSFRDQALIAMENARLFRETREALERQTATADILKVIAGSPTDVQPVFDPIASSANTLIGGFSATALRYAGQTLHLAAFTPTNPTADEALMASFPRPLAEFPPVATAVPPPSPTPNRKACRPGIGTWRGCAATAACFSRR